MKAAALEKTPEKKTPVKAVQPRQKKPVKAPAQQEPSKPLTAYLLWQVHNCEALRKETGSGKGWLGKLAGDKWKSLPPTEKATFISQAKELKETYKKNMEEFKASGGVPGKQRQARWKRVYHGDPNRPKKPLNAYRLWRSQNRKALNEEEGTPVVDKLAGDKWKSLPLEQKAVFEEKAQALMEAYMADLQNYENNKARKTRKTSPAPETAH